MLENKLDQEGYFTATTTDPEPIRPEILDSITQVIYGRIRGFLSPTLHGDKKSDSRRLVRLVTMVEQNGRGNLFRAELTGEYKPNGTTENCLVTINKYPIPVDRSGSETHYRLDVRVEGMSSNYRPIILDQLGKIYHDLFERKAAVLIKQD